MSTYTKKVIMSENTFINNKVNKVKVLTTNDHKREPSFDCQRLTKYNI